MDKVSTGKVDTNKLDETSGSFNSQDEQIKKRGKSKEESSHCSGHKLTTSQSSTDHEKVGDVKRSTGPRSKSFLEVDLSSKYKSRSTSSSHAGQGRSTHGSHGDGINPGAQITRGLALSDSLSRNGDLLKQSEADTKVLPTKTTATNPKLLDSDITFADLVRDTTNSDSSPRARQSHTGNVLLYSAQASSLVCNYLNSYRLYLAYLRQTSGLGELIRPSLQPELQFQSQSETSPPTKSSPLVLPLSCMTPVFSENPQSDPEFLELLKKTTTESIRKLWPQQTKTNIFQKTIFTKKSADQILDLAQGLSNCADPANNSCIEEIKESQINDSNQTTGINFAEKLLESDSPNESVLASSEISFNDFYEIAGTTNKTVKANESTQPNMKLSPDSTFALKDEAASKKSGSVCSMSSQGDSMSKSSLVNTTSTSSPAKSLADQSTYTSSKWSENYNQQTGNQKALALDKLLNLQQKMLHQQQLQRQMLLHQRKQQQQQEQQQQIHLGQQIDDENHQEQLYRQYREQLLMQQQFQEQQQNQELLQAPALNNANFQTNEKFWYQAPADTQAEKQYLESPSRTEALFESMYATGDHRKDYYPPASLDFNLLSNETDANSTTQRRSLKASYACLERQDQADLMASEQLYSFSEGDVDGKFSTDPYGQFPSSNVPIHSNLMTESSKSWNEEGRLGSVFSTTSFPKHSQNGNPWGSSDGTLDDRLKRIYSQPRPSQFSQSGLWPGAGISNPSEYKGTLRTSNANFSDQLQLPYVQNTCLNHYDALQMNSSAEQNAWAASMGSDLSLSYDGYPTLAVCGSGQVELSASNSHMPTHVDQRMRQSRLYQWKNDGGKPSTSVSSINNNSSALVDANFSWNASRFSADVVQKNALSQAPSCGFTMTEGIVQNSSTLDQQGASLNKLSSHMTLEQQRQLLMAAPGRIPRMQMSEASELPKQTWSSQGSEVAAHQQKIFQGESMGYSSLISPSMQILNKKILAAKSNSSPPTSREHIPEASPPLIDETSPEGTQLSSASTKTLRLGRAMSNPDNNASLKGRHALHASSSLSQLPVLQRQKFEKKENASMKSLAEELEKTYIDDNILWHEQSPDVQENEIINENSNTDKSFYNKLSRKENENYHFDCSGIQLPEFKAKSVSRPRMILGANSIQQNKEDSGASEHTDSNGSMRNIYGFVQTDGNNPESNISMRENQRNGQLISGSPQAGRACYNSSKIQNNMAMAQQIYCVSNILMPSPQQAQSQPTSRASNMVPIQGMVPNSRYPGGMIRVPLVDMSRLVYVQQMPVNVSANQPNNNHNNSTSSNPHVNVSNIITIKTDKDFSINGQGEKNIRINRQGLPKSKQAFVKVRSGSEEYTVPILGMRPSLDEGLCQARPIKTRTNPWDQDLDQDFNSSQLSKVTNLDKMATFGSQSSLVDGTFSNDQSKLSAIPGSMSANVNESSLQSTTFMQWPASADLHPEMLDMLPVRRAVPDDCGTGRVCWPDMEFMLSSRDQLQTNRRSNKPMGSNKANLISIIPRGSSQEGGKDNKLDSDEQL